MVLSRGNIAVLTGRQKSCKSTFQSCLIASALIGAEVLNTSVTQPCKVLWCDTEQGDFHLSCQANRVYRFTDGVINGLTILALRAYSPSERFEFIVDAVRDLRPDIVFIDGITDLANDVNDSAESEALVANLLALSSEHKTGIVAVIHTLASVGKLRGHLGSALERKCESSIFLERSGMGDEVKVKPKESRNKPFRSFSFTIGENGDPEYTAPENKPHTCEDWMLYLMAPNVEYTNSQIVDMLKEKGYAKSTVQCSLDVALRKDYVEKIGSKYQIKTRGII